MGGGLRGEIEPDESSEMGSDADRGESAVGRADGLPKERNRAPLTDSLSCVLDEE